MFHHRSAGSSDKAKHCGVVYMQASDFVNHVEKSKISGPVDARPMGKVDVTANDWVYSSGVLSKKEVRSLKKLARQTAHALGTSPQAVLTQTGRDY